MIRLCMRNIILSMFLLKTIILHIIILSTIMLTNNSFSWLSTPRSIYINEIFLFYINRMHNNLKHNLSHFYLLYELFMHFVLIKQNIATSDHSTCVRVPSVISKLSIMSIATKNTFFAFIVQ